MHILVTGGAGFVGSSLCLQLKKKYPHYTITAFDNLKRRGSELNLAEFKALDIAFIHGDIRNEEDFDQIKGFDVLIEASAEPSVLAGLDSNPNYVINNNLSGSINCFNACVKYKAKLIFLSTSRVYPIHRIENANFIEEETRFSFANIQSEAGITNKGIDENLNLDGARSFYGTTKLASELFIREYSEFYGVPAAVTRFGVIAGPRQMGKTDQGVVTLWMAKHFWKKELAYIGYGGTGKQVRDMLHIQDVIDLIDLQIHQIQLFQNKVYNAGGAIQSSASLQEMSQICQEISGNKIKIGSIPENRPADLRAYITNNTLITHQTSWQPKHTVQNILEDVFMWLKENEKDLKGILA